VRPDRESDLERICHAALERPAAERVAFLAEACRGDEALRRDAEDLLANESAAASFLEVPVEGRWMREAGGSTGPALAAGQRLGSYTIGAPLGVGGMSEVYLARDSTLGREVAIKVLPALFTRDPDRLARFEREARLLASLNHPNIATIYGIEHVDGIHALILEVVEGNTLAQRLDQAAFGLSGRRKAGREQSLKAPAGLPLGDALTIARQVAEAIEAAHSKGIVHRDLKPANIKIRPDGVVKVLDFGLARAAHGDAPVSDATPPSTLTVGPTREGAILGTAAYMSPEQARGLAVDRRTDIWAFGCVLYELLTGHTAFAGATSSDTIAAVLEHEPDWTALPATTPPPVRSLLRRCLQKDPAKRLRDIGDAGFQIDEALNEPAWSMPGTGPKPAPMTGRLLWAAALVGAVAATAATAWSLRPAPLEPDEVRLETTAPPTTDPTSLAISPDGKQLVFAATTDGTSRLWVRPLHTASARPLAGTEHARFPFWSPDSRSVGFTAEGQLKRIDVNGGVVRVLATGVGTGTWNQDGTILFDRGPGGGLFRVSADGGEPRLAAQIDSLANDPWRPEFLPDQRHFLFYETGTMPGIYVGQLDSKDAPRRLLDAQAATYAAPGHLIFVRQRTLFAQPFDPVRLELSGSPTVVAEQLVVGENPGTAALSASAAGPVVYRTGPEGARSQFVWFDRSGKAPEAVAGSDIGDGFNSSLSPDGRQLAFSRFTDDRPGRTADIWLLDLARGVASRFTSDPMFDLTPVWSPNGDRLAFASNRKRADGSTGSFDVYVKAATGLGNDDLLVGHDFGDPPSDWSPDGRFILYNRQSGTGNNNDIWGLPLEGDRKPFPVVDTKFAESNGQFSPDGKWIAFQSNESGQVEVYVQPFPGPGRRTRITRDGGDQARWRSDGKELFYLTPDDRLMAVPMRLDVERDTVDAGMPRMLFALRVNGVPRHAYGRHYSVSRDGQRFLVNTLKEVTLPITVVLNWKPKP